MLTTLLKTEKTVFTNKELQQIFPDIKWTSLAVTLSRYKQTGKILNPQKGIWTLPVFSVEELACEIYPKGYISLETVLYDAGVIFQRYGNSTRVVWNNTRKKTFQDHQYYAFKVKNEILNNPSNIRISNNVRKATPERALCDLLYLQKKPQIDNPEFFDNPQSLARFKELLPLYPKTTQNVISKLIGIKI